MFQAFKESLMPSTEIQTWRHIQTDEIIRAQVKGGAILGIYTDRRQEPYSRKDLREFASGNVGTGQLKQELIKFAQDTLAILDNFEQNKFMFENITEQV